MYIRRDHPHLHRVAARVDPRAAAAWAAAAVALLVAVTFAIALPQQHAPETPAFLTHLLGPATPAATPLHSPQPGVSVSTRGQATTVTTPAGRLSLSALGAGTAQWQRHTQGSVRVTPYGTQTVTVAGNRTEEFLTVASHHGVSTWRWRIDAGGAVPRVGEDGGISFVHGGRVLPMAISPVHILDAAGRDVTPAGLAWTLRRSGGSSWLTLRLDDRLLPVPYVIDPAIVFQSVATGANAAAPTSPATVTVNAPTGLTENDFMVAQIAVNGGSNSTLTAPSGWTLIRRTDNTTNVGEATYYKAATASEPASYTWTITNGSNTPRAAGAIVDYAGVINSAPVDVSSGTTGSSSSLGATAVTTTAANDLVAGFYAIDTGTTFTPPAAMVERSDTRNSSGNGPAAEADDYIKATAGSTGTQTATSGSSTNWVAQMVALKLDVTAPTGAITAPAAAANVHGAVTVSSNSADTGSGVVSVVFQRSPAGAGTWTTIGTATTSPFQVSWATTGVTDGLYDLRVTTTDGAGNATTSATITNVRVDNTAPTGSLTAPVSSTNRRGAVTVSSNSADGGSGVANAVFQYSPAGANTWTTIATDTTSPYSTSWDTTTVTDGQYDVRVVTTDNAGNATTSTSVTNVYVDNTAPVNALSVASSTPAGAAYVSGNTVFYRGAAAGSFQLSNALTDAGSGPASSGYPVLGGTTTGWTHANQTISTPAGGPYVSTNSFAWTAGTASSPTEGVVGTDAAGNTATTTLTFTNDSAAPTGAITAPAAASNQRGTITVSSNSADASSGVASAVFQRSPAGAGTWTTIGTAATSPYQVSWDTTAVADGLYDLRVVTTDHTGNSTTSATITNVRVDNTAPTGSVTAPTAGANVRGTAVTVSSNSADGGSGVASVVFQGSPAGAGSWTTFANDTASPYSSTLDSTMAADGLYDLRAITTDNAGNTTTSATIANVRIDNTAPANVPALSSSSPAGSAFQSGNTIFYRGVAAGSFQLSNGVTDAGSGPASSGYPALGGTTTGWTHANQTISTPAGGPFISTNSFAWTAGTTSSPTEGVVGSDAAGNTATSTLTMTNDSTAPTGAVSAPVAASNQRGTITVSSSSADAGSGVASALFQRSPAGAGTWTTVGTATTSPYQVSWDTTTVTDGLYDLRVITTDNVGNTTTSATIANVRVDNTAPANVMSVTSASPAGSAFQSGNTIFYRGAAAGSFQLTNGLTDAGSGPASSGFPALGGTTTGWTHTNQTISTPAGGPYVSTNSFAWTAGTTSSPTEGVVGTDAAGNTGTTTLTMTNDSTVPTGSVTAPAAASNQHGTITVSSNSADAGSGVASALFQRSPAGAGTWTTIGTASSSPYQVSWDTTTVTDGLYDLRVITTDNVGNTTTSGTIANVRVDNTAPTGGITAPAAASNQRGTITVSSNSADAGSGVASAVFQRSPIGAGTWTTIGTASGSPYQVSWDTTGVADGQYDLRVITTDNVGATFTSSLVTMRVDNTVPTGSVTAPTASTNQRGSITVSSNSADTGSGVASALFQYSPAGAGTWTTIATDTTSPYSVSWDSTAVSDGLYDLRVVTNDNAGNATTSGTVANVRVDNTVPTGSLTAPTASTNQRGTITVSSNSADTGSGVASAAFQRSPAGANTWTTIATDTTSPYSATWDTTTVTDGLYDLRVVTTDNAGNTTNSVTVANVRVDNTAPNGSVTAPSAGANVRGSVAVNSDSADAGSGVASAVFQRSPAGAGTWTAIATDTTSPYSATWDTTAVTDGLYDLRVVTTDNAGSSTTSATITNVRVDNAAPTGSLTAPTASTNQRGTITVSSNSADGGSGVASAAFQRSPAGAGTWTTIATASSSPYQVSWDTTAVTDGLYDLRVVTTDNAGNTTISSTIANVRVDNTVPSGSITAPSAGSNQRGSITVSSSSSDAGSGVASAVFQRSPAGANTWTTIGTASSGPYQVTWDTTAVTDGQYDLRVITTDNIGNSTTSATIANVRVDNTAPTGGITGPTAGGNQRGTITVASSSADTGAGVASAAFQRSPAGAGTWTTIATATTSPYQVSWDTTAVSDGVYDLRVVTTDNAGNTTTSSTVANVRIDNTAPTGAVTAPTAAANVRGSVTVSSSSADAGSGVASAVFQRSPAGAGTWTTIATASSSPYQVSWDTTTVTDGLYDLRVITTDNAGNPTTSATIANVRVDNTAPTGSLTAPAAGSSQNGTITLSSNSADGGSGVANAAFQRSPAGANTWTTIATDTTSPYSAGWDTTTVTDGLYDLRVVTTDNAGNTTNSATVANVRVDNTAPSGSVTAPSAGSNQRGTITVSSSSADAGSGVASALFQRSPAGAGTWTTIGTASSSPYQVSWDTTTVTDGQYDLRVITTDNVGNSTSSATVANVRIDNAAPTGSVTAPSAGANVRGSVTVSSSSADGGSGVASALFQRSPAGAGTWTTIGTASSSPYQVSWDTTAVADGLYDLRVVTTDNAGNSTTSATVANVRVDNTPPIGSVTAPGAGSNQRGTITVSSSSADAGSGVASSVFQRSPAGAGTWTTIGTGTTSPYQTGWDTTGVADGLYDLRVVTVDNAGNSTTSATVTNVRVDNAAPTGSLTAPTASTNQHGTITVSSNSADGGSGVANAAFQRSPAGANTWTTIATDTTSPYSAGWDTTTVTDGLYDLRVVTTDNAGNTTNSATVANVRVDNTGPTGSVTAPSAGSNQRGTITVSSSSADAGSGVASAAFQRSPAGAGTWTTIGTASSSPYQVSWDTTGVTDGQYDLRVITTDNIGNTTTSATVANVRVDNTAPTGSVTAPAAGSNQRGTITVSSSSADAGSGVAGAAFQRSPAGAGTWTTIATATTSPYQVSWDTTGAADGQYDLRVVTTDNAGNATTSGTVANVRVDNTAPTGSVTAPSAGANVRGSVTVSSSSADAGSGVASATFQSAPAGTGTWTTIGLVTGSPYQVSWDTTAVADGLYDLRVVTADNAGGSATSTTVTNVRVDNAAPTGSVTAPAAGSNQRGTITVSSNSADGGSGVAGATFQRSPAGANTWTTIGTASSSPYQVSWNTTGVTDGQYDLRVVTTDNAGNTNTSATVANVRVDNTAPSGSVTAPSAGANVRGSVTVSSSSADAGAGVSSAVFQRSPAGTGTWTTIATASSSPYQVSWDTTGVTDGQYDLRVITTDNAGNTTTSATVANVRVDNTAPTGSVTTPAASSNQRGTITVSSNSADSGSGVASAVFQRSPAGAGTWTTIGTASSSPYQVSWDTTGVTDGQYDLRVITTDNAGNTTTSATVANVRVDNTAPTGSVTAPAAGSSQRGTVTVSSDSADAGSGVASATFQRSPAGAGTWTTLATDTTSPYSTGWDTTTVTDGQYDLRVITTDNSGNTTTSSTVANVRVDNTAPSGSVTAPAAGSNQHGTVTVSSSSADAGSGVASAVFQRSPAGAGTWTAIGTATSSPYQVSWDTTGVTDGQYDLRVITTDNAGNTTTSATIANVRVDNTAPSGSLTAPSAGSDQRGTVTMSSDSADVGSGVASATFQRSPAGAGTWTTIAADATAPYSAGWDTTALADGLYDLRVVTTDNAGNTTASATVTNVRVDNSAPTGSILALGSGANVRGSITVSSDSADAGSGVASATFQRSPAGAGTWTTLGTDTTAPYSAGWDTTAVADGQYDLRVITTDNSGNVTTSATVANVRVDNTAPTGSLTAPPSGANVRGSVTLSSDSADGGSGVGSAAFQYSPAGAGTWTGITTDTTSPYSAAWDTTAVADGLYDLRVITSDNAGNTTTSATVTNVRVDNTAPTGSLTAPAAGTNQSGTILLSASPADGGSGVASATFQRSPAGSGTWTTIGSASGAPYQTGWNTASVADGQYDLRVVVADNAGNTAASTTVANVRVDNTPPTAVLINPGSPLRGTVNLTSTNGDTGSGIATVDYQYSPAGAGTWSTTPAAWDTTALADGLYDLRVVVTDNAGNATASTTVTNVLVDNTAPTGAITAPAAGANVRGTVTVSASSADAGSGVASATFQSSPAGAGTWSTIGLATGAPFQSSWDTTAISDGTYDLRVVTTDSAGNSTTSAVVAGVRIDNTPPSAVLDNPGSPVHGTVHLTSTTSDAGSGIAAAEYDYSPAGANMWSATAAAWDTGSLPDGLYDLRVVVTDGAGNSTTSATVANVMVDNTAPGAVLHDPGSPVRGTVNLTSTTDDSGSGIASTVYQVSPAGAGTWSATPAAWDTTALADGLYDLRVVVTDHAGNITPSAVVPNVRVDNTAPTGVITTPAPGANVRGTVTVSSDSADAGSGVNSAVFQRSPAGAGTWTTIATDTAAPYTTGWDTTAVTDGLYDLRIVTTDVAGNTTTSPTVANVRVDNTPPTASLADPGSPVRGTVSLNSTTGDSGSGIASTVYQVSPAGAGTWSATPAAWDTTALADGLYDLRVVVTDNAGNDTTSATVANVRVDNTAPDASLDNPGSPVHGTVDLTSTNHDAGSGIASTVYLVSPAGAGTWSATPAAWDTTALADGLYDLRVVVTDNAGNNTTSATVTNVLVDNTAPTGGSIGYADGWDTAGSIAFTVDPGSDSGSGIDSGASVIERQVANLSGGSCGAFSGPWTAVSAPDTAVADGSCYRYRYRVSDHAGNVTIYTSSAVVMEDSSGPDATLADPGADVRSTVNLSAAVTDPDSGVTSVAFQRSPAGAGTWTTIDTDSTAPYTAAWDTTAVADGQYDLRVVAHDVAGNISTSPLVTGVRVDNTAPSASMTSPDTGAALRGIVSISSSASDAGSGLASRTYEISPAGANTWSATPATWDTTAVADGPYDLRVVVTDNAGNSTTSAAVTDLVVDNTNPSVSLTDPGSPISGQFTLAATAGDAGSGIADVTFQSARSGHTQWTTIGSDAASPYHVVFDTTGLSDGVYDLRAIATDAAGNTTTSTVTGITVDNTPADVSITSPSNGDVLNGGAADPLTISATSSDATVQQVEFFECSNHSSDCTTGSWDSIGVDTVGPLDYSIAWPLPAQDGDRAIRAVTTDNADNHGSDIVNVTIDRSGPSGGSVSYPDGYAAGPVTVAADPGTDAVTGVALGTGVIERQQAALSGGSCDTFAGSWSTVSSPDATVSDGHCYRYRYSISDHAGNTTTYSSTDVTKVDGLAPTATLQYPGTPLSGTVTLHATAGDTGGSGIDTVSFQSSPTGAGTWTAIGSASGSPYQTDFDTTGLTDGIYDLRAVATDAAGNSHASAVVSAVVIDNTPGDVAISSPSEGDVVNSSDADPLTIAAQSTDPTVQQVEFFECSDHSNNCATGTWNSIGVDSGGPLNYSIAWPLPAQDGNRAIRAESTDGAHNHSSGIVNVTIDRSGPSGGSVDYPNGYTGGPISVTADPGSDAVTGINAGSETLERDQTTLSGGSCGAFTGSWTSASTPDAGVSDGHCYRYRYSVSDHAGNATTYTSANVAKVDGLAPTTTLQTPGTPLSGSVALHATAGDTGGSGIASISFQSSPTGAGTWTTIGSATAAPYQTAFDTTALMDGIYDLRAVATDGAGNSTASAVVGNITIDNTSVPPPVFTFSVSKVQVRGKGKNVFLLFTATPSAGSKITMLLRNKRKHTVATWKKKGRIGAHKLKVGIRKTRLRRGTYILTVTATTKAGQHIKRRITVKVPKRIKRL